MYSAGWADFYIFWVWTLWQIVHVENSIIIPLSEEIAGIAESYTLDITEGFKQ